MIAIAHPLLGGEEGGAVPCASTLGQLPQGEDVAAFERLFTEKARCVREARAISSDTTNLSPVLLAHQIDTSGDVIFAAYCSSALSVALTSLSGTSRGFLDKERVC
jgi:dTDP-4-amino-4,6-dideoxygalactose transaminase